MTFVPPTFQAVIIGGGLLIESKEELIEHLRRYLQECREGDYHGYPVVHQAIARELVTAEEIGSYQEELADFRQYGFVETAINYAHECLDDDFTHLRDLARLVFQSGLVETDDLPLTAAQIDSMVQEQISDELTDIWEEVQLGLYDRLERLVDALESGVATIDELNIDTDVLSEQIQRRNVEKTREIELECESGNYANLNVLELALQLGRVPEGEAESLRERIEKWRREQSLGEAKEVLNELRDNPNLFTRTLLKSAIASMQFTPEELGVTKRQLKKLLNPHPIRNAIADRIGTP